MAVKLARISLEKGEDAMSRASLLAKANEVFTGKKTTPNATTLRLALMKLEIAPLDDKRVHKYKKQNEGRKRLWQTSEKITGTLSVFCALTFMYGVYNIHNMGAAAGDRYYVMAILGGICAVVLAVACGSEDGAKWREYSWSRSHLYNYGFHNVPDFVLDRAIQLKQECPDVHLYVDSLSYREYYTYNTHPDPFLVAQLGDEEFFIDVWHEPQFERFI
jgi:hypothetical protein